MTVGSALIKTINPERTLWVSGQMKSGVYLWVKKILLIPLFLPTSYLSQVASQDCFMLNLVVFI